MAKSGKPACMTDTPSPVQGNLRSTVPDLAIGALPVLSIRNLSKTYKTGHHALKEISLDIHKGEIFALLGPNGAGKTTLISVICGLVNATKGTVVVAGHDTVVDFRAARRLIGLVPQELTTDAFETVWATTCFSRGLFGKPANPAYIEKILRALSLWEKKDAKIRTLSGGMKRRVLIAKALAHEPEVLFLDEPSAGVDVELRRDMWELVRQLREEGTTIILTTHYIEEAEEMADRVGVIRRGELILVEDKVELMRKLGQKRLTIDLAAPLATLPPTLEAHGMKLEEGGQALTYVYDTRMEDQSPGAAIAALLATLSAEGIIFDDLHTEQSSLEDIFVSLVRPAS